MEAGTRFVRYVHNGFDHYAPKKSLTSLSLSLSYVSVSVEEEEEERV